MGVRDARVGRDAPLLARLIASTGGRRHALRAYRPTRPTALVGWDAAAREGRPSRSAPAASPTGGRGRDSQMENYSVPFVPFVPEQLRVAVQIGRQRGSIRRGPRAIRATSCSPVRVIDARFCMFPLLLVPVRAPIGLGEVPLGTRVLERGGGSDPETREGDGEHRGSAAPAAGASVARGCLLWERRQARCDAAFSESADEALYRAKDAGRNRVEASRTPEPPS
jgi:hypothetical protein